MADENAALPEAPVCARCGGLLTAPGPCPACAARVMLEAFEETLQGETGPRVLPVAGMDFGDYELETALSEGASGIVYRARQRSLKRTVAIKVLRSGALAGPREIERFHSEAEALAQLDHPHLLTCYETGAHAGLHFISMRLVEGRTLAERMPEFSAGPDGGRPQLEKAVQLSAQLARAMHYAHMRRLVHRDLKPANILITPAGEPCIVDFGLAKNLAVADGATQSGEVFGTPHYLAPEALAAGSHAAAAFTDIYSLGVILYELITGRRPFDADSHWRLMAQIEHDTPPSPRRCNRRIDADLETICLKCLEKDPARRYPSADALAEDLDSWIARRPVRARRAGMPERLWRWARRRPAAAALSATAAAVALTVMIGLPLRLAEQARQARELRRQHYAAETARAFQAAAGHDLATARRIAREIEMRPGTEEFRGTEWRLLQPLIRGADESAAHVGGTTALAFSSFGQTSAAGGADGCVRLIDAVGQPLAVLPCAWPRDNGSFGNAIAALAFLPDGSLLAAGSRHYVCRWDWPNRTVTSVWPAFAGSLAVTSDGRHALLGSGAPNGMCRVVEVASGRVVRVLPESGGIAAAARATPIAATGSWGNAIALWDSSSWALLRQVATRGTVAALALSPDGRLLAWIESADRSVWMLRLAEPAAEPESPPETGVAVLDVAFSHDGLRLLGSGIDGAVRMWETGGLREAGRLEGHAGPARHVAAAGPGAISAGDDGTLRRWPPALLSDGVETRATGLAEQPLAFCDGAVMLVRADSPDKFSVWTPPALQPVAVTLPDDAVRVMAGVTAGDRRLMLCAQPPASTDGNAPAGTWLESWGLPQNDSPRLLHRTQLQQWLSDRWSLATARHALSATARDGSTFAASLPAGKDREVLVWDAAAGTVIRSLPFSAVAAPLSLQLSSDGALLALTLRDGSMEVHGVRRGGRVLSARERWASFSPDGHWLASGNATGAIHLRQAPAFSVAETWQQHRGTVTQLAWAADGQTLASCAAGEGLVLWHRPTRHALATLLPGESLRALFFTAGDGALVAVKQDGAVHVFAAGSAAGNAEGSVPFPAAGDATFTQRSEGLDSGRRLVWHAGVADDGAGASEAASTSPFAIIAVPEFPMPAAFDEDSPDRGRLQVFGALPASIDRAELRVRWKSIPAAAGGPRRDNVRLLIRQSAEESGGTGHPAFAWSGRISAAPDAVAGAGGYAETVFDLSRLPVRGGVRDLLPHVAAAGCLEMATDPDIAMDAAELAVWTRGTVVLPAGAHAEGDGWIMAEDNLEIPVRTKSSRDPSGVVLHTGWHPIESRALLPGESDLMWAVGGEPAEVAAVAASPRWPRAADDPPWIAARSHVSAEGEPQTSPRGMTVFRTHFDLGIVLASPRLALRVRADDVVEHIRLNGWTIPVTRGVYLHAPLLIDFADRRRFREGMNTLEVEIANSVGPCGMMAAGGVDYVDR